MSDNTTALSKSINLKWFSYRFAEQVLNSNLLIKNEIESVLLDQPIDMAALSRPRFNAVLQGAVRFAGLDEPAPGLRRAR